MTLPAFCIVARASSRPGLPQELDCLVDGGAAARRLACAPQRIAKVRQRLACTDDIALGAQHGDCFLVLGFGLAGSSELVRSLSDLGEQPSAAELVRRQQLERPPVVTSRPVDVQLRGTIPREREKPLGWLDELRDFVAEPAGVRQLERFGVVVREDLGLVRNALAGHLFDPDCGGTVFARPLRARDLRVCNVPDEHVRERVLDLSLDGRSARAANELPAGEVLERLGQVVRGTRAHRLERARPEDLAVHGGVLEDPFPLRRQSVDACRNERLDRLRDVDLSAKITVVDHARELLGIERVTARSLEQRGLGSRGQDRPCEQGRDEPRHLLLGEGRHGERRRVPLTSAPGGVALEEFRPSSTENEERNVGRPVDEMVEELHERSVGPMEVLEDEDERGLLREPF
jgi:hypothetical protein